MRNDPFSALVFGGSGELGSATCKKIIRDGGRVMATYHRNHRCREIVTEIEEDIVTRQCDITDAESVAQLSREIEMFSGHLDAMVYAVGSFAGLGDDKGEGGQFSCLSEIDAGEIERNIAVHTRGAVLACQLAEPFLQAAGGGNIVLLGTLNGTKLALSPVHFAAAKSALLGITQSLAKELGKKNIRINVVVPGIVNGVHLKDIPVRQKELYLKHSARRRFVESDEVAEVMAWFARENTYVTGQTILVDGGL